MKALQRHEKVMLKELAKRLPPSSYVHFSFYRGISWSESVRPLGLRPRAHSTFSLRVHFGSPDAEDPDTFQWEGLKLQDAIRKLEAWLIARGKKRLCSPALSPAPGKMKQLSLGVQA